MKKNYMRPESTVMKIEMASMIATSPNVTVNSSGNVDADKVESREFDDWDE